MGIESSPAKRAVETRNKVLKGEPVEIEVPVYGKGENSWPEILGAFAAVYSTPRESDREELGKALPTKKYVYPSGDIYQEVQANLSAVVSNQNLGTVVSFTGSGDLVELANHEADAYLPTKASSDAGAADRRVSSRLTERGIRTLADKGIGVALLLTEKLAADERLSLSPKEVRGIVSEQGHRLLTPLMSSQQDFKKLVEVFGRDSLIEPRDFSLDQARKYITYDVSEGNVSNVRLKDFQLEKTGAFGCPFLHTKPAMFNPAWKIVVDTMWDAHLAPRVQNPVR